MSRLTSFIIACLLICSFSLPPLYGTVYGADATTKVTQKSKAAQPAKKKVQTASKKTQTGKQATAQVAKKKKRTQQSKAVSNYKGAILYDMSARKTVFNNRADTQVPPASLTKILSMYVAFDQIKSKKIPLDTKVKVSAKAASKGGSRMGLRTGDTVTLDQLLHGMAICSGNDASVAIAEYFGKSESGFVSMMNTKARQLGMTRSTFKNASGLPAKGQFTTARDMLTLARSYLNAYPENLGKYHSYRSYSYNGAVSENANPLLGRFSGADGLKTGYVGAAGYNLISTAKRGNKRLIGVILGAPSPTVRAKEATALLESGFAKNENLDESKSKATQKQPAKKVAAKKQTSTKVAAKKQASTKVADKKTVTDTKQAALKKSRNVEDS